MEELHKILLLLLEVKNWLSTHANQLNEHGMQPKTNLEGKETQKSLEDKEKEIFANEENLVKNVLFKLQDLTTLVKEFYLYYTTEGKAPFIESVLKAFEEKKGEENYSWEKEIYTISGGLIEPNNTSSQQNTLMMQIAGLGRAAMALIGNNKDAAYVKLAHQIKNVSITEKMLNISQKFNTLFGTPTAQKNFHDSINQYLIEELKKHIPDLINKLKTNPRKNTRKNIIEELKAEFIKEKNTKSLELYIKINVPQKKYTILHSSTTTPSSQKAAPSIPEKDGPFSEELRKVVRERHDSTPKTNETTEQKEIPMSLPLLLSQQFTNLMDLLEKIGEKIYGVKKIKLPVFYKEIQNIATLFSALPANIQPFSTNETIGKNISTKLLNHSQKKLIEIFEKSSMLLSELNDFLLDIKNSPFYSQTEDTLDTLLKTLENLLEFEYRYAKILNAVQYVNTFITIANKLKQKESSAIEEVNKETLTNKNKAEENKEILQSKNPISQSKSGNNLAADGAKNHYYYLVNNFVLFNNKNNSSSTFAFVKNTLDLNTKHA